MSWERKGQSHTLLCTNTFEAPSSQSSPPLQSLSRGLDISILSFHNDTKESIHKQGFCVLCVDFGVGRGKKRGPTSRPSFFPTHRKSTVILGMILVIAIINLLRHGLETLFQLIVWDSQSSSFLMPGILQVMFITSIILIRKIAFCTTKVNNVIPHLLFT